MVSAEPYAERTSDWQRFDTNFLNIILIVNYLISWIGQNPAELDPSGLTTCGHSGIP